MNISPRRLWIASSVMLVAVTATALWAQDDPAPASAPAPVPGFFETHYLVTELIALAILAILMVIVMASDTTWERVEFHHRDNWGFPLGTSYSDIRKPKTPSSPEEIKRTLILFGVIYLFLRLFCCGSLFSSIYQIVGRAFDEVHRDFFGH